MESFGRFELETLVARGGMGEVFRARMHSSAGVSHQVALKRIYHHLAADPRYRQLFVREAKLASTLEHPNIVRVFELGEEGEDLFIAMELVNGVNLSALLDGPEGRKPLEADIVAVIAFDILDALEYAHSHTRADGSERVLVHQDISPQNILVHGQSGNSKLCDFGVAHIRDGSGSLDAIVAGKVLYMSPEQLRGEKLDGRSDIYSLGLVLYELLTATSLRPQSSDLAGLMRSATSEIHSNLATRDAIPKALGEVIDAMLIADPEKRLSPAGACRDAIEPFLIESNPLQARRRLRELVRERMAQRGPEKPVTVELGSSSRPVVPPAPPADATGFASADPTTRLLQPDEAVSESWTQLVERHEHGALTATGIVQRTQDLAAELPAPLPNPNRDSGSDYGPLAWLAAGLGVGALGLALLLFVFSPGSSDAGPEEPAESVAVAAESPPLAPSPPPVTEPAPDVTEETARERSDDEVSDAVADEMASDEVADSAAADRAGHGADEKATAQASARNERPRKARKPVASRRAYGTVTLNARPWAYVEIDGTRLDSATPIKNHRIRAGTHVAKFIFRGGQSTTRRFSVSKGQSTLVTAELPSED